VHGPAHLLNTSSTQETSMSIALIGASGNAASRILKELSDRGHHVTAIARDPEKIAKLPNVSADKKGLASLLSGHDVVEGQLCPFYGKRS
jgi:putative NADH-flavin reductase